MNEFGKWGNNFDLKNILGLDNFGNVYWNFILVELVEDIILSG